MGIFLLSIALAAEPDGVSRDIPIPPPSGAQPAESPPAAPPIDFEDEPEPVIPPLPDLPAPAEPEAVELSTPERQREASNLYLQALEAWKATRWTRAWVLASHALTLDPDLAPARLLVGYAQLKRKAYGEAQVTIDGLALEPGPSALPEARRREADRLLRRQLAPFRRDQWNGYVSTIFLVERMGDAPQLAGGAAIGARAPILERLAVRLEVATAGSSGEDLGVAGPRFAAYAVTSQPIAQGRGHIDLSVGPSLWVATGRYWPDGSEPYFGARAAAGIDVRLGPTFGLRWEAGASVFPEASDALAFYAAPLDFRFGIDVWLGK